MFTEQSINFLEFQKGNDPIAGEIADPARNQEESEAHPARIALQQTEGPMLKLTKNQEAMLSLLSYELFRLPLREELTAADWSAVQTARR